MTNPTAIRHAIQQSIETTDIVPIQFEGDEAEFLAAVESAWDGEVDYNRDHTNEATILDAFGWTDGAPNDEHMDWRLAVTLVDAEELAYLPAIDR